jgi:hypothetical protein
MEDVFVVMTYNENTGQYDLLTIIFSNELDAYKWIDYNTENKNNYKVECWKVN